MAVTIKSDREIQLMREAGIVLAKTHEELEKALHAGMTTYEVNKIGDEIIRSYGCVPSFLNYHGYPASICVSVNEEVVHGIPSARKILKKGDIISLDLVVELDGYMGDSCITVPVGHCNKKMAQLLKATEDSLYAGIKQAVVGNHVGDIGYAVECAIKPYGYGILRDYVGHGIGTEMHEDPEVPNYGEPGHGPRLEEGMVICIEPMITMGSEETYTLRDGWSVVTVDGLPSAHMEHTIAITKDGPRILTMRS